MRTIRTKVYQFSELSKESQGKAIEKFREVNTDYEWWEGVYDDFYELCKLVGIEVNLKKVYFMGFAYQGQGATFEADIDIQQLIEGIGEQKYLSHAPNIHSEVTSFTPEKCNVDKRVLKLIYDGIIDFSAYAKSHDRPYSTKVEFSSNYTYNECINYDRIEAELSKLESWIEETINEFDNLLFRLLENEYDFQTTKEAITETIQANEYEFTKDGELFHK